MCEFSLPLQRAKGNSFFCFFLDIMDNYVADRLEKMKLMIEEEEIIPISDEGRLDAIESCNLSLMGKF